MEFSQRKFLAREAFEQIVYDKTRLYRISLPGRCVLQKGDLSDSTKCKDVGCEWSGKNYC